ncbi:hypothetical protein [Bailinhaonella thermotolerans]|uniref:Sigma-70 family RNA polymerase sigma factor n=1 Tax=Bailinhaonella thermotolerans TaxID=1070861 RepID=A0A3A4B3Q7_9ACTN|nr:hypothetical protein [Bailinhaonella thermotolerans]RJL32659.1 hypothetical protein D5H75_14245 [Bailinhaonella thermotolerans]
MPEPTHAPHHDTGRDAGDARLAEILRGADPGGLAAVFDAYAERLYDYACSHVGDRETGAVAVHDALIAAREHIGVLRDDSRLRAWLYALTRNLCLLQPRAPEPGDDATPEQREVRELLRGLSRREREVLDLVHRHGLSPAEVNLVIGAPSKHLLSRGGRALEAAAAPVVLARAARSQCPDLAAMTEGWAGPLTPMSRKRLARHIESCSTCEEIRRREVSAEGLLRLLPAPLVPLSLRRLLLDTASDPELAHTRVAIADRAALFGKNGFPQPIDRRARKKVRAGSVPMIAAVACLLVVMGVLIVLTGGERRPDERFRAALPPAASALPGVEVETTDLPVAGEPAPPPSPSVTPPAARKRPPAGPTARPTPPGRGAVRTPPTSRAASRTPPPVRRVSLSVSCPGSLGAVSTGTIGLTARNGTVRWKAAYSPAEGVTVEPVSGTATPSRAGAITVRFAEASETRSVTVSITSPAGDRTCAVSWTGPEAEQNGDDDPTLP